MQSLNTRQSEKQRLASHLTASLAGLWIRPLLAMTLGALLGTTMMADRPKSTQARSQRQPPVGNTQKLESQSAQRYSCSSSRPGSQRSDPGSFLRGTPPSRLGKAQRRPGFCLR